MQQIARDVQDLSGGAARIVTSAEQIAAMAVESAAGANSMATGTTRVTEAIIQVSATSEETSASAEQVSASTEELSAQSQELAATASHVRTIAEGLDKAVARFKSRLIGRQHSNNEGWAAMPAPFVRLFAMGARRAPKGVSRERHAAGERSRLSSAPRIVDQPSDHVIQVDSRCALMDKGAQCPANHRPGRKSP